MKPIQDHLHDILAEPLEQAPAETFHPPLQQMDSTLLLESANTFGTPHYLLDVDRLKERASFFIHTMRQHLPNSHFFYAFKCNDLPYLIKTLKETGFQADVASLFELTLALKLGFEQIVFNGPGKSVEELASSIKEKKRVAIHLDNAEELERLITLAAELSPHRKVGVGFRLNSELSNGGTKKWSKFGFELDQLKDAVWRVERCANLEWTGLHFHASFNKTPYKYLENIKTIGTFLAHHFNPRQLSKLRYFDIGGGFYPENQAILHKGENKGMMVDMLLEQGIDKDPLYEQLNFDPFAFRIAPVEPLQNFAIGIAEAFNHYILPFNPAMAIYFEPGRFIVTPSTTILLRVMAVKKNSVIVDGGINMLGDYKFAEYAFAPLLNVSRPSLRIARKTIYGSLCDPHDIWGYSYYGEELRVGDVLAVPEQGAYTFSSAWRFIKAIPAYIAVSNGQFVVAKEAETFENRYAGCQIPL